MVTLIEMTPDEFPGEMAASYAEACAILSVPSIEAGYGLELDQDESGARWTRVTTDVDGIRSIQAIWHSGMECGYEPPAGTVSVTVPGWPVECPLALAGLPEPHDPPGAVRAPDGSAVTRNRRKSADQMFAELADTGHQDAATYAEVRQFQAYDMGATVLEPAPRRLIDRRVPVTMRPELKPSIERALREAWGLSVVAKPPPGSVRARKAWPRDRAVRATGDGWTLLARTGTAPILIVLLDDPAANAIDIIDVSDTEKAIELLDALTAAASRL
jgi:hypothetical protein